MAIITRTSFSTGDVPTAAQWNTQFDTIYNDYNGNIQSVNLEATFRGLIAMRDENETITGTWTYSGSAQHNASASWGGFNVSGIGTIYASTVSATNVSATNVTASSIWGTLQTAAQPNITSHGILTSLSNSGTLTQTGSSNFGASASWGGFNVSGIGTIYASTVSATNVSATNVTASSIWGTLQTAAQPNITSLGTLNGLFNIGTFYTSGVINLDNNVNINSHDVSAVNTLYTVNVSASNNVSAFGNVTVGTSSTANSQGYARNLTISTITASSNSSLELQGRRAGSGDLICGIEFINYDGSTNNQIASIRTLRGSGGNDEANLTFLTKTTGVAIEERMRLDSSGNLAIGVTAANIVGFTKSLTIGKIDAVGNSTIETIGRRSNSGDLVCGHSFISNDSAGTNKETARISLLRGTAYDDALMVFSTTVAAGALTERMRLVTGLQLGSPTGGDKGAGTINCASDIYKNNTAYTNPDYAFERYFTGKIKKFIENEGAKEYKGLMKLNDLRDFVKNNFHLPGLNEKSIGIFKRADFVLEKLEEIFIHLFELNDRIINLEIKHDI